MDTKPESPSLLGGFAVAIAIDMSGPVVWINIYLWAPMGHVQWRVNVLFQVLNSSQLATTATYNEHSVN